MSNIWFMSDPHYNHKNIVKGCTNWKETKGSDQKCREFKTLEEHNDAIVSGINKYVKEDDILYCLGDWSFGGINSIWEFRNRIRCKNIHLILGNHDEHIEANKILPNCHYKSATTSEIVSGDSKANYEQDYSWNELTTTNVMARDLFKSVDYMFKGKIGCFKRITLCHYAMRVWDKSHKGAVMLYGHSHDSLDCNRETGDLDEYGLSMDVGMDAAYRLYGEYRPFHIDDIARIMSMRAIKLVDHHNSLTN